MYDPLQALGGYLTTTVQPGINTDPGQILARTIPILLFTFSQFIPIIALIFIGGIGSRFILNATRISQRRVIQDALGELGPLQSTLAGLPPRKPMMQVAEQSLQQTRQSFTTRTRLSSILFLVGVALFAVLVINGIQGGFTDTVTTAVIGGTGVISFLLSIIGNNPEEQRKTIEQITRLEREIAQKAQQAELLDLFTSHLIRNGKLGNEDITAEEFLQMITKLHNENQPSPQEFAANSDKGHVIDTLSAERN